MKPSSPSLSKARSRCIPSAAPVRHGGTPGPGVQMSLVQIIGSGGGAFSTSPPGTDIRRGHPCRAARAQPTGTGSGDGVAGAGAATARDRSGRRRDSTIV
ncbi:hypothetical protein Apa02nite_092020 [Actinoplanes palleronii]|uniref:Uncharacterized protein n=1 Tax=Actinoplanes palleronii TaxID=113570 RepID=A0ABQ4BQX9_9ACTN|nr:hypothetical protein Apa02nite_092020 [Actinoplanes palleronii]